MQFERREYVPREDAMDPKKADRPPDFEGIMARIEEINKTVLSQEARNSGRENQIIKPGDEHKMSFRRQRNNGADPADIANQVRTYRATHPDLEIIVRKHTKDHERALEECVWSRYGHHKALKILTKSGLYDSRRLDQVSPPTESETMDLLRQLTPRQIELIRWMQYRGIILKPKGLSFGRFRDALNNSRKTWGQKPVTTSQFFDFRVGQDDKDSGAKDRISSWSVGVGEIERELPRRNVVKDPGKKITCGNDWTVADLSIDNVKTTEDLIIEWTGSDAAKAGGRFPTPAEYALMQMIARKPLDHDNYAILSGEAPLHPLDRHGCFLAACMAGNPTSRIHFQELYGYCSSEVCFRHVVMVD